MPDGTALPYRVWLPTGRPTAVVLALHGMNDSRDAWEYPAPGLRRRRHGGVCARPARLRCDPHPRPWPGTDGLIGDARVMARTAAGALSAHQADPDGREHGRRRADGAGDRAQPADVDGYVLIAPAVWGRSEMNVLMRVSLWLADQTLPALTLTGRGIVKVTASDNREALIRLSRDPLTIHGTRVDAIKGLVDLMDRALAAAPHFHAPSLFLYGGHDELVPKRATAATWQALPPGPVRAFYPNGYHLLLRDNDRALPIGDILAWIKDPQAPLPSGADKAAAAWLQRQE